MFWTHFRHTLWSEQEYWFNDGEFCKKCEFFKSFQGKSAAYGVKNE